MFACNCYADFIITLKSGSQLRTDLYWEEGNQIKFQTKGGVTGIPEEFVASIIEKANDPTDSPPFPPEISKEGQEGKDAANRGKKKNRKAEEVNPLKEFYEQKKEKELQLNEALARLRESTRNKDKTAKKKARQDMRKFAEEMYAIADEVKKRNGGKLPDHWWK